MAFLVVGQLVAGAEQVPAIATDRRSKELLLAAISIGLTLSVHEHAARPRLYFAGRGPPGLPGAQPSFCRRSIALIRDSSDQQQPVRQEGDARVLTGNTYCRRQVQLRN